MNAAALGNVLIVDDEPAIRDLLAERLRLDQFSVDVAASGEEALARYLTRRWNASSPRSVVTDEVLKDESASSEFATRELSRCEGDAPYTALVVDMRLTGPGRVGLNGIDLLRLVRMLDRQLTILMISGCGDLSAAVRSLREGADDYVSKPIKIWDIKDRLTTAIGRRRSIGARQRAPDEQGLVWGSCFQTSSSGIQSREGSAEDEHAAPQISPRGPTTCREGPPGEPADDGSVPTRSRTQRSRVSENVDLPSSTDTVEDRSDRSRPGSAVGTPTNKKMGRETGSRINSVGAGAYERRFGENCAGGPASSHSARDAAGTPGREGDQQDRLHELPGTSREGIRGGGGSTERLGERDDAWASSPLNALFLLARRAAAAAGQDPDHGDEVAACLSKLGAYLAGKLRLRPSQLEALSVSARTLALGHVRDEGTPERAADPRVPARLLEVLASSSVAFEAGLDEEATRTAAEILDATAELRQSEHGTAHSLEHADDEELAGRYRLPLLFELAERWVALRRESTPPEASRRLREDFREIASPLVAEAATALRQLA